MPPALFRTRSMPALGMMLAALAMWPGVAIARQLHVLTSQPAAETIIHGRHAEYVIRFDGPVNHRASHLQITQEDHVIASLTPRGDSAVDVLFASGTVPPPGRYLLHWEAVSADGELSKGDIPFNVEP